MYVRKHCADSTTNCSEVVFVIQNSTPFGELSGRSGVTCGRDSDTTDCAAGAANAAGAATTPNVVSATAPITSGAKSERTSKVPPLVSLLARDYLPNKWPSKPTIRTEFRTTAANRQVGDSPNIGAQASGCACRVDPRRIMRKDRRCHPPKVQ